MSQYCIIRICQRAINIINCAEEAGSLITEQGAVKEKMRICFNIKTTQTSRPPANDLNQGVVL